MLLSFHAPSPAIRKVARAAYRLEGSYRSVAGSPQRLGALGLQAEDLASWDEVADLDAVVDTHQTAIALTMMHPDVATIATIAGDDHQGVAGADLGRVQPGHLHRARWPSRGRRTTPAVNADGTPDPDHDRVDDDDVLHRRA